VRTISSINCSSLAAKPRGARRREVQQRNIVIHCTAGRVRRRRLLPTFLARSADPDSPCRPPAGTYGRFRSGSIRNQRRRTRFDITALRTVSSVPRPIESIFWRSTACLRADARRAADQFPSAAGPTPWPARCSPPDRRKCLVTFEPLLSRLGAARQAANHRRHSGQRHLESRSGRPERRRLDDGLGRGAVGRRPIREIPLYTSTIFHITPMQWTPPQGRSM
jgi:hypothetical protein